MWIESNIIFSSFAIGNTRQINLLTNRPNVLTSFTRESIQEKTEAFKKSYIKSYNLKFASRS